MAKFVNITHKRPEFTFRDSKCIGRACFHPDQAGGNVGHCGYRAKKGCPDLMPEYDEAAAKRRRAEGWTVSK